MTRYQTDTYQLYAMSRSDLVAIRQAADILNRRAQILPVKGSPRFTYIRVAAKLNEIALKAGDA